MARVLSILLFCLLTACATVPDAIVPPLEKVVHIDPSALKRCQRLLELPINATYCLIGLLLSYQGIEIPQTDDMRAQKIVD